MQFTKYMLEYVKIIIQRQQFLRFINDVIVFDYLIINELLKAINLFPYLNIKIRGLQKC